MVNKGTCHVPRPKVVTGISSRSHFKKESSPLSACAAVELDCRLVLRSLTVKHKAELVASTAALFCTCVWQTLTPLKQLHEWFNTPAHSMFPLISRLLTGSSSFSAVTAFTPLGSLSTSLQDHFCKDLIAFSTVSEVRYWFWMITAAYLKGFIHFKASHQWHSNRDPGFLFES